MSRTEPFRGAVITGGASGLGRALALMLGREGTPVVVADVDEVGLAETVRLVRASGGSATAHRCDVTDPESVAGLFDAALEALAVVDLWVNNAGIAVAGEVGDVPLDQWHRILDINLRGVVYGCHVVTPYLKAQGRGAILNTASLAGLLNPPEMAAYNVTKAGVVALTETLYGDLLGTGVTATVLCPSFFETNLMDTSYTTASHQGKLARAMMRRSKITAADVAATALADARAGRLHSLPMADARWYWRLKRLMPSVFHQVVDWLRERAIQRRTGQGSRDAAA